MPRFRRTAARVRRNLAWSGFVATRATVAPGAQSTQTICDATGQLAVGLSPVLQRIRGSIVVDPDISPVPLAAQFWTVFAAIHLNPTAPDLSSATGWADESILWTSLFAASSNGGIIAGADSELYGQYTINHERENIDVKAKRRLENPQEKVYLTVRNGASSTAGVNYSCVFRCLHAV